MANIPVTRAELAEKVIAAIRQEPGCADVKEISITSVMIVDGGPTWHASITDSGTAEINVAYRAAVRITELYTRLFQLVD